MQAQQQMRQYGRERFREREGRWSSDYEWQQGTSGAERRAKALGFLSIGLGLTQLLAPRTVGRLIGAADDRTTQSTLLAVGLREIASGIGILTKPQAAEWLWARVVGDVMDLALLSTASRSDEAERDKIAAATAAVLGITVVDTMSAVTLGRERENMPEFGTTERRKLRGTTSGIHVVRSITVNRPREEVYQFWRNFENLPRFMAHLESVQVINGHSRWRAKAPAGMTVEWEAEVLIDRPNESIAWRSIEGADIPNQGSVQFLPGPSARGTEIRVELKYDPPGGKLGKWLAKLFGEEPGQQIAGDLRRFKQVIETGEVVHSDASIHRGMHPARPSEKPVQPLYGSERR